MNIQEYSQNQFRVINEDGSILGTINSIGNYQFIKNGLNAMKCDEAYFMWLGFLNNPENFEVKSMIYNHQEFMRGLNEWSADDVMLKIMEDDEDEDLRGFHQNPYEGEDYSDKELSPMSEAFTDALMEWTHD